MTTIEGTLDELTCERAVYDEQATNLLKDSEHLSLVLLANGAKQWRLNLLDQTGTSTIRFLGNYPSMSLVNARQAAMLELSKTSSTPPQENVLKNQATNQETQALKPLISANNSSQNHQDLFGSLPLPPPTPQVSAQASPMTAPTTKTPSAKKSTKTTKAKSSVVSPKSNTKKINEATPTPKTVKHTFGNTIRRWLKANQERWKESRFQQIEKIALTILSPQLKPYDFKELTPTILRDCLENIASTDGKMVAREALLIVKGVLEYAVEKDYINQSPLEKTQSPFSFTETAKNVVSKTTSTQSVKTRVQALKQKSTQADKTVKATVPNEVRNEPSTTVEPLVVASSIPDPTPVIEEPNEHDVKTNLYEPLPESEPIVATAIITPTVITPYVEESAPTLPTEPSPAQEPMPSPNPSPVQIPLEEITLGYLLKKQIRSVLQHLNFRGMLSYVIVAAISSWLAMWLVQQEKELLLIKLDVTEKKLEVLENGQKLAQDNEQKLKTALSELQVLANECRVDLKKAIRNSKKD